MPPSFHFFFLLFFLLRALASQKTNEKERKANQSIPLLLFNSQSIALFISAIDGVDWEENGGGVDWFHSIVIHKLFDFISFHQINLLISFHLITQLTIFYLCWFGVGLASFVRSNGWTMCACGVWMDWIVVLAALSFVDYGLLRQPMLRKGKTSSSKQHNNESNSTKQERIVCERCLLFLPWIEFDFVSWNEMEWWNQMKWRRKEQTKRRTNEPKARRQANKLIFSFFFGGRRSEASQRMKKKS